ncbi:MAG: hypothetical protein KDK30_00215 [Leptospiraceae bacterium]|nr:hypothetical protein [Leptospiraceae bacterium]MCB1316466.1 hypothetical protein [Leptospiraceae bacterium]MCB1318879.1 hypothetical protein [Leptospiraceae bacterium]
MQTIFEKAGSRPQSRTEHELRFLPGVLSFLLLCLSLSLLTHCGEARADGILLYSGGEPPRMLSEWGLFQQPLADLQPVNRVIPYDLNTMLFTDYASKFRTVWVPPGDQIQYRQSEAFDFPEHSIISKTFFYPETDLVLKDKDQAYKNQRRLLETRLLIKGPDGWTTLPYVWNEEQTEATLRVAGATIPLEFRHANGEIQPIQYQVPDRNQCTNCHMRQVDHESIPMPIGPKARHINRTYTYSDGTSANQIEYWKSQGILTGVPSDSSTIPRNAVWDDASSGSLDERARAYLDANCTHCHSPAGPARTSGLFLAPDVAKTAEWGVCKTPVAAGRGSGNLTYDIVPGNPDESILVYRMLSNDPGIMMPELGRTIVHREGVELMRAWIRSLPGECGN